MSVVPDELQAARLRMLWSRPYLGAAIWSLTPVEARGLGTLGVDKWGRLYYDPETLRGWSPEEREAVLYHEVGHVLRDHAARLPLVTDDPVLANVAGDLEINDDLAKESVRLPPDVLYPKTFGLPDFRTAEEYVEMLLRQARGGPSGKGGPRPGGPKVGKGGAGSDPAELPDPKCGSGATGRTAEWEAAPPGTPGAPDGMGPAEAGVVRKAVAEAVRAEAAKGRGTVPDELVRWAEGYLKPKVDWRRELRGAVRAALGRAAGMEDYSFRRPHRRSSALGVVLPSLARPVPRVAVVVDTSGSMRDGELSRAMAEIDGVLRTVGQPIEVLSVDAEVHARGRVVRGKQVRLVGGGGTDMRVGFAAVAASRPRPDVVVFLTDGLTPWPESPPAGMRTVVCVIGGADGVPAWARCVRVEPDA